MKKQHQKYRRLFSTTKSYLCKTIRTSKSNVWKAYSYDSPIQLLINDNPDAELFSLEHINRIKHLKPSEIKSLITQYKIPIKITGTKKQILNDLKIHFYDEYNFGLIVPPQ